MAAIIFQDDFNRTSAAGNGLGTNYTFNTYDSFWANQAASLLFINPSSVHLPYDYYDSYNVNYTAPAYRINTDRYVYPCDSGHI